MYYDLPILETARLILREITIDDYKDMYEYAHLSFVGPVAGWEPHRTLSETKTIIQMFLDKKKYGQLGVFAIVYKANQKMIGTVELHSFVRGFKAELGYTVHPDFWGLGIAVEASKAVIIWGFETLLIKRLECSTFTTNPRSRRVCEKLALPYEGIKKKAYMLYDGSIHDLYCYALTDDEFTKWKES